MTDEQYQAISRKVDGTTTNVYHLASNLFGHKWTDEDFDKLEEITGVFKCELCDHWQPREEKDRDVAGCCKACVDDMDRDKEEDDE